MVSMPNITIPTFNFSEWQPNLFTMSIMGYVQVVNIFFWPIVFSGIIAYVYRKNMSAVSAGVAILIIFAGTATSDVFLGADVFVLFMQLALTLVFTGLVVVFLLRRRN